MPAPKAQQRDSTAAQTRGVPVNMWTLLSTASATSAMSITDDSPAHVPSKLMAALAALQALTEALAANSNLQDLDLRSNAIGLTGCRLLSSLLQDHNSSIRALSLAGNMEEPDGTQAPVLQVGP